VTAAYGEKIEDAAKRCIIPALLLQPLLENAVSHGIASMADGGLIRLEARVQDGRLGSSLKMTGMKKLLAAAKWSRTEKCAEPARSPLRKRSHVSGGRREDKFRVSMSLPAEYGETE